MTPLNLLLSEIIRNSDSKFKAINFYQILELPFQRRSFFEKQLFMTIFIHYRSEKMNWSFQGLNFSGTILPYSKPLKNGAIRIFSKLVYFDGMHPS